MMDGGAKEYIQNFGREALWKTVTWKVENEMGG
jgi:hypothetical protein